MNIVIIGSGGVATSLALAFAPNHHVLQVYSRTLGHARQLSSLLPGCDAIDDLRMLQADADIYIVAVKDDAIPDVLKEVPEQAAAVGLWLHTSGSTRIEAFGTRFPCHGVLYPLQSFSKTRIVEMSNVPLFVEGNNEAVTQEIEQLALSISHEVRQAGSAERERLHLAAVFACNFANHMWTLAHEVLHENEIPFEVLLPLIKSTVAKLDALPPAQSQTGPAQRGDTGIMERHLASLHGDKADIYRIISQSIINHNT